MTATFNLEGGNSHDRRGRIEVSAHSAEATYRPLAAPSRRLAAELAVRGFRLVLPRRRADGWCTDQGRRVLRPGPYRDPGRATRCRSRAGHRCDGRRRGLDHTRRASRGKAGQDRGGLSQRIPVRKLRTPSPTAQRDRTGRYLGGVPGRGAGDPDAEADRRADQAADPDRARLNIEAEERNMHAQVGDRIVVAGATVGTPVRDGEIVEVHGTAGEPPYLVRWSDTGRESLFFPGPDSHIEHDGSPEVGPDPGGATPDQASESASEVKKWHVDLYLYEHQDSTAAHAVLHSASRAHLDGRGAARLRPGEANVPEIGDEVAVARALRGLSDRLLTAASDDMSAIQGHSVHLDA